MLTVNIKNIFKNPDIYTSAEFAWTCTYLGSGAMVSQKDALETMKFIARKAGIKLKKTNNGHYELSNSLAWNYFAKAYSKFVKKNKIKDIHDLREKVFNYMYDNRAFDDEFYYDNEDNYK